MTKQNRHEGGTSAGDGPRVRDLPIGLGAAGTRAETDSMGAIDVPADEGSTLREAALASGYIDAADFDRIVKPAAMVGQ
jgi:hypothetical protein